MEKRVIGLLLTLVGLAGLIIGGYLFLHGGQGDYSIKLIAIYGVLGLLFFLSGVGLISGTKDKAT